MTHEFSVEVGPIGLRLISAWREPVVHLRQLYRDYPQAIAIAHYTTRLEPTQALRRWVRPAIAVCGDHQLPDAVPLPLRLGLLAAEMGMNMQLALGERRFLLLHAATVAKGDRAVILTGESGSGKSTLAAWLGEQGWRLMGDEFALLEAETGRLYPFPRPISLKNESIALMAARVADAGRFGPLLPDTPKGTIRHLRPRPEAVAAMAKSAEPALIVFPSFGQPHAIRPVPPGEAFVRLTQASTNYARMGRRGFDALTALVTQVPAVALDYPDGDTAQSGLEALWDQLGAQR